MRADFIQDKKLQKRVEDSLDYIFTLYETTKKQINSDIYIQETYRVLILYCASIIEALLFELYHQGEQRILRTEYKDPQVLSDQYRNSKLKGTVVIATRTQRGSSEVEIGLNELITFLHPKPLKQETRDRLLTLNSLRNSFHLRKTGSTRCTRADVDEALDLLYLVFTNTAKHTEKKK